jgi:hypothetical protein
VNATAWRATVTTLGVLAGGGVAGMAAMVASRVAGIRKDEIFAAGLMVRELEEANKPDLAGAGQVVPFQRR